MVPGIEQHYPIIGREIAASIHGPWTRAWAEVIVFRGSTDLGTVYQPAETSPINGYDPTDGLRPALLAVRDLFVKQGKPWGRALFELEATGKFRMHFDYDSTDADGFARYDHDTYVKWGSAQILWYEPPKVAKEGT